MKIGLFGCGAYGMAISSILIENKCDVTMWTKFESEKEQLETTRQNERLIPGFKIDDSIKITTSIKECIKNKDLLIIAIPAAFVDDLAKSMKPYIKDNPFYFNISHSHDYYIMACSPTQIGIDIEKHRDRKYQLLSKRYYTENEQQYVNIHNRQGFFDIWSMKESYTKFLGETIIKNLKINLVKNNQLITFKNNIYFYKIDIDINYSCFMTLDTKITTKEIYLDFL